jgi:hypothetical protein
MHFVLKIVILAMLTIAPQAALSNEPEPAEVMLFGVFHFANPGLDVVKTDQINVMTEENQAYLDALADRIAGFNPTKILLEYPPEKDEEYQKRYQDYLDGAYELGSNENYQLGFRIAERSAAETVHGFDEQNVHWNAEPLFAYLEDHDEATSARMDELIKSVTADMEQAHKTLTLKQLLLRANDAEQDRLNRSFYLMTNDVGEGDNFVGADATASWWHRNFRMFAIIQRYAQPGERVLVIGGQGHVAIYKLFLADDDRRAVDVTSYL